MKGDIDIWDIVLKEKVGESHANSTVDCYWAPDSRKLITAVLVPRVRVDNEIRV